MGCFKRYIVTLVAFVRPNSIVCFSSHWISFIGFALFLKILIHHEHIKCIFSGVSLILNWGEIDGTGWDWLVGTGFATAQKIIQWRQNLLALYGENKKRKLQHCLWIISSWKQINFFKFYYYLMNVCVGGSGGQNPPPSRIYVDPRKMLKEQVANFLWLFMNMWMECWRLVFAVK